MANRNTLPEISGGSGVLRDALGSSVRTVRSKLAPNRQLCDATRDSPSAVRSIKPQPNTDACRPSKVKVPFNLPHELAESVRDAVFALSGPPYCLSLAAFAEQALRAELMRLEEMANQGRCFEARRGRLKPGRSVE
jgi:hypothetical protein